MTTRTHTALPRIERTPFTDMLREWEAQPHKNDGILIRHYERDDEHLYVVYETIYSRTTVRINGVKLGAPMALSDVERARLRHMQTLGLAQERAA